MKIIFISDTHGFHEKLNLPEGDMIIHAGDVSKMGGEEEIIEFINWFKDLDFKHKIFIAGNHDFYLEKIDDKTLKELIPENIIYLNDSGITIDHINIWGSPIQPWFFDWAFNRKRGEDIKKHWDLIPSNTDILITHGPPMSILDKTNRDQHVGCEELLEAVQLIQAKIHVFGHIHEDYGIKHHAGTQFINASVLNVKYQLVNDPIEIEYDVQ